MIVNSVYHFLAESIFYGEKVKKRTYDFVTAKIVLEERPSDVFCFIQDAKISLDKSTFFIETKIKPHTETLCTGKIGKYTTNLKSYYSKFLILYNTSENLFKMKSNITAKLSSSSNYRLKIHMKGIQCNFSLDQRFFRKHISSFSLKIIESARKTEIALNSNDKLNSYIRDTSDKCIPEITSVNIHKDHSSEFLLLPTYCYCIGLIDENIIIFSILDKTIRTKKPSKIEIVAEKIYTKIEKAIIGIPATSVKNIITPLTTIIISSKIKTLTTALVTKKEYFVENTKKETIIIGKIPIESNLKNIKNSILSYFTPIVTYSKYSKTWEEILAPIKGMYINIITGNIPKRIYPVQFSITRFTTPTVDKNVEINGVQKKLPNGVISTLHLHFNEVYGYRITAVNLRIGVFEYFHKVGMFKEIFIDSKTQKQESVSTVIVSDKNSVSFKISRYNNFIFSVGETKKRILGTPSVAILSYLDRKLAKNTKDIITYKTTTETTYTIVEYGEGFIAYDFKKYASPLYSVESVGGVNEIINETKKLDIYKVLENITIDPFRYYEAIIKLNSSRYKYYAELLYRISIGSEFEDWKKNEIIEYFKRDDIARYLEYVESSHISPIILYNLLAMKINKPSIAIFEENSADIENRFISALGVKCLNFHREENIKNIPTKRTKTRKLINIKMSSSKGIVFGITSKIGGIESNKVIHNFTKSSQIKFSRYVETNFINTVIAYKIVGIETISNDNRKLPHPKISYYSTIKHLILKTGLSYKIKIGVSSYYSELISVTVGNNAIIGIQCETGCKYSNSIISSYSATVASLYYNMTMESIKSVYSKLGRYSLVKLEPPRSTFSSLITGKIQNKQERVSWIYEKVYICKLFYEKEAIKIDKEISFLSFVTRNIVFNQQFNMKYEIELVEEIKKTNTGKSRISKFLNQGVKNGDIDGPERKKGSDKKIVCTMFLKPRLERDGFDYIDMFDGKNIVGNFSSKTKEILNSGNIVPSRIVQFDRKTTLIQSSMIQRSIRDISMQNTNIEKLKDWDEKSFELTESDLTDPGTIRSSTLRKSAEDSALSIVDNANKLKDSAMKNINLEDINTSNAENIYKKFPESPTKVIGHVNPNHDDFISIENEEV